ncbi:unnamed protein product [Closterium sp. Yama58-4]|nr:unnamed protein product [Closterium sp. Yama58-4]
MYVIGVGATDFALAVASVFSKPGHRRLGAMLFAGSQSSGSSLEDAGIEEARKRLRKRGVATRVSEGGASGGRPEATASAAPATGVSAFSAGVASSRAGYFLGCNSATGSSEGLNTDPLVNLLTYRVAHILKWLRIHGSDFISGKSCFKDSPQGKVLPMRHLLRDLPSLLVRFGTVLEPLDGSSLPEWEEWPEGDEATVKFPEDSRARCFGLGMVDGRQGGKSGSAAVHEGSLQEAPMRHMPSRQSGESRPIIRCRADADLILEFAGVVLHPPACAHCNRCITVYISHVPFVALIANFAYRPAAVLLDLFLSIFPPHTEEFQSLLTRLDLDSPLDVPRYSVSGKPGSSSAHVLRKRVEQMPVAFSLSLALMCAAPLVQQSGTEGGKNSGTEKGGNGAKGKAGGRRVGSGNWGEGMEGRNGGDGEGDSKILLEEVQSWLMVATTSGMRGDGETCSGSRARKEVVSSRVKEANDIYLCSRFPRFFEDMKHGDGTSSACGSSGSSFSKKAKKGEEPAYLKAWPGGVNLVACLREMLLGEPCYHPAAPSLAVSGNSAIASPSSDADVAALSVAAAATSKARTTSNAQDRRVCGAAGCEKVEGVDVR